MVEVVLALLLTAASSLGVVLWRKVAHEKTESRRMVDAWRADAREVNENREATIEANIESIGEKVDAIGDSKDDRKKLADLLND